MISDSMTRRIQKRPALENAFDKRANAMRKGRYKSRLKFKNVALSNKDNWLAYV